MEKGGGTATGVYNIDEINETRFSVRSDVKVATSEKKKNGGGVKLVTRYRKKPSETFGTRPGSQDPSRKIGGERSSSNKS